MGYYYTVKKSETMNFPFRRMELETVILIQVTQTQKDKYHIFSLIGGFKLQIIRYELHIPG